MKKKMTAACMAAVLLVFTGCGSSAGVTVQDDSRTEQESQNTKDRDVVEKNTEDAIKNSGQGDTDTEEHDSTDALKGNTVSAESDPAQLAGKTISILGDSISTFREYNPEGYAVFYPDYGEVSGLEDTWWQRIVDELSLTLYVNGSSAGTTVVGDSTDTENPLYACNELRTGALAGPQGACPEMILVYLGTNDLLNTVPLGLNDGTILVEEGEITTFSDAYTLMIDKLQANYPPAEICCFTLLPVGDYGTETPYVDFVNGDGLTAADYSETIVKIAENRGLFVIDLQNCGITIDNLHEMTTDGVHPTPAGMTCIAEAVGKALAAGGRCK